MAGPILSFKNIWTNLVVVLACTGLILFYQFQSKDLVLSFANNPKITFSISVQSERPVAKKGSQKVETKQARLNNEAKIVEEPQLVGDLKPEYPYLSKVYGEEGSVDVEVQINPNGSVSVARIVKSSQFKRLDDAAVEALQKARFGSLNQAQVSTVTVNFELSGQKK